MFGLSPPPGCNLLEIHVVTAKTETETETEGACSDADTGWAVTDIPRPLLISMMRRALESQGLLGCVTRHIRVQSSFIREMTLERVAGRNDRALSSVCMDVIDMRATHRVPLVCTMWRRQTIPSSAFPCYIQRHDVRHCMRRQICVSRDVSLFFETHMNESLRPVYRAWIEVVWPSDDANEYGEGGRDTNRHGLLISDVDAAINALNIEII